MVEAFPSLYFISKGETREYTGGRGLSQLLVFATKVCNMPKTSLFGIFKASKSLRMISWCSLGSLRLTGHDIYNVGLGKYCGSPILAVSYILCWEIDRPDVGFARPGDERLQSGHCRVWHLAYGSNSWRNCQHAVYGIDFYLHDRLLLCSDDEGAY